VKEIEILDKETIPASAAALWDCRETPEGDRSLNALVTEY
jgi:hypothetical protein